MLTYADVSCAHALLSLHSRKLGVCAPETKKLLKKHGKMHGGNRLDKTWGGGGEITQKGAGARLGGKRGAVANAGGGCQYHVSLFIPSG
jgi:hypothetical protein